MNQKKRKPYTTEENLEMASMHEAAHAAVALALGMPVDFSSSCQTHFGALRCLHSNNS